MSIDLIWTFLAILPSFLSVGLYIVGFVIFLHFKFLAEIESIENLGYRDERKNHKATNKMDTEI